MQAEHRLWHVREADVEGDNVSNPREQSRRDVDGVIRPESVSPHKFGRR